jgi:hypothetical protein
LIFFGFNLFWRFSFDGFLQFFNISEKKNDRRSALITTILFDVIFTLVFLGLNTEDENGSLSSLMDRPGRLGIQGIAFLKCVARTRDIRHGKTGRMAFHSCRHPKVEVACIPKIVH